MIDSRELRKGNLVKCLVHLPIGFNRPKLTFSEVIELRENDIETGEGFHKYREVGPIQLTEEILEKCGGEKTGENEYHLNTYNEEIKDIILLVEAANFYLGDENKNKSSLSIESLHHLQNLYFDLTKIELRVKL